MNKSTLIIVVLAGLVVLGTGLSLIEKRESSTIEIGFIGPLSGDGVGFGETEKNALELAVSDVNSTGGILGQKVKVIYEDGRCNAKDALSAANKLVNTDGVKIILGGVCSAETLAVAPITNKNKVLLFSAFSSNPEVSKAGEYVFRNAPSDRDVALLDGETLAKDGVRIALLSEDTAYSLGVRDIIIDVLNQRKVSLVANEIYSPPISGSTLDYRAILGKIKAKNPDVLYINPGTSARSGGLIVKQARELGLKISIHGNFSIATPEALGIAGDLSEGIIFSDASALSNKGESLILRYEKQFGASPANTYEMGASYDRLFIIKQAIEAVGNDADKIKDYLLLMPPYSGTVGSYSFDKNGDVMGVGFAEYVIKEGKKVPLR